MEMWNFKKHFEAIKNLTTSLILHSVRAGDLKSNKQTCYRNRIEEES